MTSLLNVDVETFYERRPRLSCSVQLSYYSNIETPIVYKTTPLSLINKLLESKWRPSGSRESDSQSQVRHGLRQLCFIYVFGYTRPPNYFANVTINCHIFSTVVQSVKACSSSLALSLQTVSHPFKYTCCSSEFVSKNQTRHASVFGK